MPCKTPISPNNSPPWAANPPSVGQALRTLRARLAEHADGPEHAAQAAEWLLAHVLGWPRSRLWSHAEAPLSVAQWDQLAALAARRLAGEPLAYLTGQAGFHALTLTVGPATLIPRPETELLVGTALALALPAAARVADLGTGSGAIALALATERPRWQVVAMDRSADALAVAHANVGRLDLDRRVLCVQGDWCAPLAPGGCDLIVANPPYLAANDPHLPALRHEPRSALVAGPTGLEDLARIIREAAVSLAAEGWLLLEHGWDQGQSVQDMLTEAGYRAVQRRQDFAGHDRIGLGQRPHP